MRRVIVAFDGGTQRSFEIGAQEVAIPDAEEARAWLLEAFDALDCEPTNPMGKLLAVDLILGVARGGCSRFRCRCALGAALRQRRRGPARGRGDRRRRRGLHRGARRLIRAAPAGRRQSWP